MVVMEVMAVKAKGSIRGRRRRSISSKVTSTTILMGKWREGWMDLK